jgi:hypothetical protein
LYGSSADSAEVSVALSDLKNFLCCDLSQLIFKRAWIVTGQNKELDKE